MVKHKHAAIIKAWAEDQTKAIQYRRSDSDEWLGASSPNWDEKLQYRIKPECVYPETQMTDLDLNRAANSNQEYAQRWSYEARLVANAAIRHAVDNKQVMLPGGEMKDEDIIKAIIAESLKQNWHLSDRAYAVIIPAVKSLLVTEPEIEALRADRAARDMAIAEAVMHKVSSSLNFTISLAEIIASVK